MIGDHSVSEIIEGVYVYCKAPGSSDKIDRMIFNHKRPRHHRRHSVSEINGVYFSQQAETTAPSLHLVLCDAGLFAPLAAGAFIS